MAEEERGAAGDWIPETDGVDGAIRMAVDPESGFSSEDAAVYLLRKELTERQEAALVPLGRSLVSSSRFPYRLFEKRSEVFLEKVADFRRMAMFRTGTGPHRELPGDFEAFETLLEITGRLSGWSEDYLVAVLDRGSAESRFRALNEIESRGFDTPVLRAAIEHCTESDPTDSVRERAIELRRAFVAVESRVPPEQNLDLPWVACRTEPAAHWLQRLVD
ncbi:MAG: hypothetical protein AAF368_17995, partial [Planctomycetota bacterium]